MTKNDLFVIFRISNFNYLKQTSSNQFCKFYFYCKTIVILLIVKRKKPKIINHF